MTVYRVVQEGRLPLVVMYLELAGGDPSVKAVRARLEVLRAALPGQAIVATVEDDLRPSLDEPFRLIGQPKSDAVVLVGYSAGCQAVRRLLLDGVHPEAVVAIDGTHAALPPQQWQIDVWRELAGEARRAERLFVATATQQLYVEHLPEGRYMASRHVLELALGEELEPGAEVHEGALHAISYASANVDKEAHMRQAREVLPEMLRRYVAPWIGHRDLKPENMIEEEPPTLRSSRPPPDAFGLAVLEVAKADLDAGYVEHGKNAGEDIERLYLLPLGLPAGAPYCAAAMTSWIRRACEATGRRSPIPGSSGAKAIMGQFEVLHLWTPRGPDLRPAVVPGAVLVWDRSDPARPETRFHGHIEIVCSVGDEVAFCIGGNADCVFDPKGRPMAVCMTERRLDDPRLLGAGRWA